jgi:UDP-N-acetylmuramyl pentapeptide phosphotransferase/UDP-N-acetylglucosamine-1-phosphate transferase
MAAALDRASASVSAVLGASIAVALIGFVEDVRGLSIEARLIGQLAVGTGLGVTSVVLAHGSWWVVPVVAIGFAGYVNAANFMDGVDSISALHGVVAGAYFSVLGGLAGHPWLQIAGVVCAAIFIGFAPWNLAPRLRVFLGDVGSYLLGGLVASCSVLVVLDRFNLLVGLAPLLPYIADTAFTFIGRVLRGEHLTQAHRSHVYQRLTLYGWSHLASGAVVGLTAAIGCVVALLLYLTMISVAVALVCISGLLGAYLSLPSIISSHQAHRASA